MMKYCNDCKMHVDTEKNYCPLCGDELAIVDDKTAINFPIPKPYAGISAIKKINKTAFFASILLSIICVIVNIATYSVASVKWSVVAVLGIFYCWSLVSKCILQKGNVTKVLFKQLITVSALLVAIDVFLTDFSGWSLWFGVPILAFSIGASTLVITLANLLYYRENLHYSLLSVALGSLQLILMFFFQIKWWLLASGLCNLAILAVLYIVAQKKVSGEIKKRLHI